MEQRPERFDTEHAVRWGVGCLVAIAALIGILILVSLIAIALQPPTWVQVLLGIALAVFGAALAWLIAAALRDRPLRR